MMRYKILNLIVAVAAVVEGLAQRLNNKAFDVAVRADEKAQITKFEQSFDLEDKASEEVDRARAQLRIAMLKRDDTTLTANGMRADASARHQYATLGSAL